MQRGNIDHRHVWILSGTGEGPPLVKMLIHNGWHVSVSVVSQQASLAYDEFPLENLWVGPLKGIENIKSILAPANNYLQFDWVIDATHPFAIQITKDIDIACKQCRQPLIRYERPLVKYKEALLIDKPKDLMNFNLQNCKLLMAIGSRQLQLMTFFARNAGAEVFARVLPSSENLQKALAAEIPDDHLALLHPFKSSLEGHIEQALCEKWNIEMILCRQSGGITQNTWQKICDQKRIQLILISRPLPITEIEIVNNFDSLIKRITLFE